MLLLHGHEQSATSWRWVIPALGRTHRVLALSLPGLDRLQTQQLPENRSNVLPNFEPDAQGMATRRPSAVRSRWHRYCRN